MIRALLLMGALIATPALAEPMSSYNGRLFVHATVNGVPTEALLDSAAESTIVDSSLASKAKLGSGQPVEIKGSGGTQKVSVVSGVNVSALGQQLSNLDVVVMDLGDLSSRLIKRPTSMVLGREIFDSARLMIDIQGGHLRAVPRSTEPAGRLLPLSTQHGVEALPVTVNGTEVQAELDFGNGSQVLISKALADRLKLQPTGTVSGGGIGGAIVRKTVVLKSLEVGGVTFNDVPAAIDELPNAGDLNVGTSILRHFVVTTDYQQKAVWLAKAIR
jgi:predicted aspartyl protease